MGEGTYESTTAFERIRVAHTDTRRAEADTVIIAVPAGCLWVPWPPQGQHIRALLRCGHVQTRRHGCDAQADASESDQIELSIQTPDTALDI